MSDTHTVTLTSQTVCPRMQDIFNLISGQIDAYDVTDIIALLSLGVAIAKESGADLSEIFSSSELFADAFLTSVKRHLERQGVE